MTGHFTGVFALYVLPSTGPWWGKTRYEFMSPAIDPLTWHQGGFLWQPDRHFDSDGGSIPRLVQCIPALQKDRYWASYGFHDSHYRYGGVYRDGLFVKESRAKADDRLYDQLLAQGATTATAKTVWGFVRAFGGFAWDTRRQAEARFKDGITVYALGAGVG